MTNLKVVIQGRRLEVDVPADWPDRTVVEIRPESRELSDEPMSAREIAETLAAMDAMQPLEVTDAEQAAWENARAAQRQFEKANFPARVEELRQHWQ